MNRRHERWPHYPHWERLEKVFKFAAGHRWRKCASEVFGVSPSKLRAKFDTEPSSLNDLRNLDIDLIRTIDDTINKLEARLEEARNLRKELVISRNNHRIIPYGPPPVPPRRRATVAAGSQELATDNVVVALLEEALKE